MTAASLSMPARFSALGDQRLVQRNLAEENFANTWPGEKSVGQDGGLAVVQEQG